MSQQTLHRAWRYLIYIRELGAEPVAYEGGKHRTYAAALEQQYARLSRAAMATDVRAAKARAVGLIKRKGLMRAAESRILTGSHLRRPNWLAFPIPPSLKWRNSRSSQPSRMRPSFRVRRSQQRAKSGTAAERFDTRTT